MTKTLIIRILGTVLVTLVLAAGVSVNLRPDHESVVAGAEPLVPEPGPPPDEATPTTAPPITDGVRTLRRGDRGTAVADLQLRLRDLGYWLGEIEGSYGPLTEQAVMAFQKIEGLVPDGASSADTQVALAAAGRPTSSAPGDLIEVDKARQVLLVIRDGIVVWTLNTSTCD